MQADLAPFAAGLPDDRGSPMRPKMPLPCAFGKECNLFGRFWEPNAKKRAANYRKPASFWEANVT
jgi:hypothetical protein